MGTQMKRDAPVLTIAFAAMFAFQAATIVLENRFVEVLPKSDRLFFAFLYAYAKIGISTLVSIAGLVSLFSDQPRHWTHKWLVACSCVMTLAIFP